MFDAPVIRKLGVFVLSLGMLGASSAAEYPDRSIRLIVPAPAGGTTDILGRLIAHEVTKELGQQVIVENRAGASGSIGMDVLARAEPDGYTIGVGSTSTLSTNTTLYSNLPYDPLKDLQPVSLLATFPNLVVVSTESQFKTLGELMAYAKANPGKVEYGSGGNGTTQHLGPELFKMLAKLDMLHVPYGGVAPAMTALIGGETVVMFENTIPAIPHIKSGRLRVLAVTTKDRVPSMPDVPTIAESGVPGFDMAGWQGIVVPAGTPELIVDKLNAVIKKALADPAVSQRLLSLGAQPTWSTPGDFDKLIRDETTRWAEVIKVSGAKVD